MPPQQREEFWTYGENEEKFNEHGTKWQNTSHQCSATEKHTSAECRQASSLLSQTTQHLCVNPDYTDLNTVFLVKQHNICVSTQTTQTSTQSS